MAGTEDGAGALHEISPGLFAGFSRLSRSLQRHIFRTWRSIILSEAPTGNNSRQEYNDGQIQGCFFIFIETIPGSPYRMITRLRKTAFIRHCQICGGTGLCCLIEQQSSLLYVHCMNKRTAACTFLLFLLLSLCRVREDKQH